MKLPRLMAEAHPGENPRHENFFDLSEAGGVRFLDFGVDSQFQNCIDGLILVDLMLLSPGKRARYIPAVPMNEALSVCAG